MNDDEKRNKLNENLITLEKWYIELLCKIDAKGDVVGIKNGLYRYLYTFFHKKDLNKIRANFVNDNPEIFKNKISKTRILKGVPFSKVLFDIAYKSKNRKRIRDRSIMVSPTQSDFPEEHFFKNIIRSRNPIFADHLKVYRLFEKEIIKEINVAYKVTCEVTSSLIEKKVNKICNTFKFNDEETTLFKFFLATFLHPNLAKYFDDYNDFNEIKVGFKVCDLSLFTSINEEKIDKIFSKKVIKKSMLFISNVVRNKLERIILTDNCKEHILSLEDDEYKCVDFIKREPKEVIPVEDFNLKKNNLDILDNFFTVKHGWHILFYGLPGVGKTELTKNICKKYGYNSLFLKENKNSKARLDSLEWALKLLGDKDVLVIDEAESFLTTRSSWNYFSADNNKDRSHLNSFLENKNKKVIWIVNHINGLEDSTKRRLSYSLKFETLSLKAKRNMWTKVFSKYRVDGMNEDKVDYLVENFKLSPALIVNSVQTALMLNRTNFWDTLNEILNSSKMLHTGKKTKKPFEIYKNYSLDYLNTDCDIKGVVENLKEFCKREKDDTLSKENHGVNLLFWGQPGTGKSCSVDYLAKVLKKKVVKKTASDLLSKWVGESEGRIRDMFKEAESTNSILFMDEADSLFRGRNRARNSWEITQTNELLQHMEDFKGIFICCTNFKESLDKASIRRFIWKIKFDYLTNKSKVDLFKKSFDIAVLTDAQQARIEAIPIVSAGDYKVVRKKLMFKKDPSIDELIELLWQESIHKDKEEKRLGI